MQLELKKLQKKLGITFIYITHDQEEAINMSDRIAVMNQVLLSRSEHRMKFITTRKQVMWPRCRKCQYPERYGEGVEGTNLKIALGGESVLVASEGTKLQAGTPITLAVRSENLIFDENMRRRTQAEVVEKSFAGGLLRVVLKLADGTEVVAKQTRIDAGVEPGQKVTCFICAENAVLVDLPDEAERGAEV